MKFKGFDCIVVFNEYEDTGDKAIVLFDAVDNSQVAVATINMPDIWLEKNQVLIKDYSENEGMADALLRARVVTKEVERIEINSWGSEVVVMELAPEEMEVAA